MKYFKTDFTFNYINLQPETIYGFSSDPKIVQMIRYFLNLSEDKLNNPYQVSQVSVIRQYAQILFNCIVHDKIFLLPLWMPIMKVFKVIFLLVITEL